MLRSCHFHYTILDESQAVKNPVAKTSRAVRMLNSDHRLVLTGTPIENTTLELWSQFAFLNPGLLGNLDFFRQDFANPIERHQDDAAATMLRKTVFPFILRRTKQQVARNRLRAPNAFSTAIWSRRKNSTNAGAIITAGWCWA